MGLLFPRKCILCRRLLQRTELDICGTCREDTEPWHNDKRKLQFLDSFVAVWYYEGYVRRALLRFKFSRARHLASGLGRRMALRVAQELPDGVDVITWVPVSFFRRLRRGYDQGQLLANAVGKELGIPVRAALRKTKNNKAQSSLRGVSQRRANVMGVYRVTDPGAVHGKRVLLIDDVLTTGATAGECARMLRAAGVKEIHCAAIAAVRK